MRVKPEKGQMWWFEGVGDYLVLGVTGDGAVHLRDPSGADAQSTVVDLQEGGARCVGIKLNDGRVMREGETWDYSPMQGGPLRHVLCGIGLRLGEAAFVENGVPHLRFSVVLSEGAECWRKVEPHEEVRRD